MEGGHQEALETYLRHEPARISKSRIKHLREMLHPEYRLRVDEFRIFYDIDTEQQRVVIIVIVPKEGAEDWLQQFGVRSP